MKPVLLMMCVASYAAAAPTPTRIEQIVDAAQSFLGSLTPVELAKAQRPLKKAGVRLESFGDAASSPTPPGIGLGTLNASQRSAALAILSVVLSPTGYQKVIDAMDADQALAASGTPYRAGNDFYYFAVYGTPSPMKPWRLDVIGHHLALHIVVAGANVSLTPLVIGAEPTMFVRDGKEVRPLGRENDKAFRLMNALDAAQQKQATLVHAVDDVGSVSPRPEGLCASAMTKAERELLVELVTEWVGMLNAEHAAQKLRDVRANLDQTYFAWSGPLKNPSPMYVRITGPTVQIELGHPGAGSGTGVQAGGVNHVHAIYRDPTEHD